MAAAAAMAARGRLSSAPTTPSVSRARFRAGTSSLHALVRLGGAGLLRAGQRRALDTDALTEWLAARAAACPTCASTRLRVDVGRVADVMSVQYAEMRRALPVSVGAPKSPSPPPSPSTPPGWPRSRRTRGASVRLVRGQPRRAAALHDRVLRAGAQRQGGAEERRGRHQRQLRAAGGAGQDQQDAGRQRPGRGAGGRLAVAVRLRPARQRHPPGAAARHGRHPLSHRRRAAHRLPGAADGDERDDGAHQAAGPHGRGREAAPAGRPHQDAPARRPPTARAARWRCGCRRCPPPSARRW